MQPCGTKLALERRFWAPGGVKLALERLFGRLERKKSFSASSTIRGLDQKFMDRYWSDTPGHRQRCGGFKWLRHSTDPACAIFFKNFRKFFSIFRVFVNAVRVQNFFGTSGRSRSVCCQSFSSVRRLAAEKTPKNRNGKKCKL